MSTTLRVIGAAVAEAGRLLLVSKLVAPEVYYLPGGKPQSGEPDVACLRREVMEELGVGLRDVEPLCEIRAPAALEDIEMRMRVFSASLVGTPAPAAEIASLIWWPVGREVTLAPAVGCTLVPRLRRAGLLCEDA